MRRIGRAPVLWGAVLAVMALIFMAFGGNAGAMVSKEIIQAVKNGVPNVGDNRVVMGELFARDG